MIDRYSPSHPVRVWCDPCQAELGYVTTAAEAASERVTHSQTHRRLVIDTACPSCGVVEGWPATPGPGGGTTYFDLPDCVVVGVAA